MLSFIIKDKVQEKLLNFNHTLQLLIGETLLGTLFGIALGPHGANAFHPHTFGGSKGASDKITLEAMRIILVIGLFAIAVELPRGYVAKHAKRIFLMVVPTMTIGWVVCAGPFKFPLRICGIRLT